MGQRVVPVDLNRPDGPHRPARPAQTIGRELLVHLKAAGPYASLPDANCAEIGSHVVTALSQLGSNTQTWADMSWHHRSRSVDSTAPAEPSRTAALRTVNPWSSVEPDRWPAPKLGRLFALRESFREHDESARRSALWTNRLFIGLPISQERLGGRTVWVREKSALNWEQIWEQNSAKLPKSSATISNC